jgi:O-antigen/teichoic acid export membrane protein
MVGYGVSQTLRLVSTLTLAHLLVPQAFGLVALVNVFLTGLEMLSDLGIGMDVVQHPRGDDPVFINTAFLIQAGRGLILWLIATALAYPFAYFYHQPAVLSLLIVGSLSVALRGLASGSIWGLTRHVELGKLTRLTTGSDFFGLIVSLVWAFLSPTAWALVMGRIASTLCYAVSSHLIAKHRVSLAWDSTAAKAIFVFGSGIFLSTASYFLGGEAERLVVGKFVTLVELGCFSLALSISAAITKGLQQVVSQVFFPMMAVSLREDREAAARHFKKARYLLLAVSACVSLAFIFGSRLFVSLALGPKYAMTGWMLQLLGVRGALELFFSVTASTLFALGTAKYAAIGNVLKLVFLGFGLTVTLSRFGFHQALWVLTLAPLVNYIPLLFGLQRHCKSVMRAELVTCGGLLCATAIAMFVARMF